MVILAIMILIGIHKYPEDKVNFENLNQTGRVWILDSEIIFSWDFNDLVEQVRKDRHNYRSEVPRFSKEIIEIGWNFFSFWKNKGFWPEFPKNFRVKNFPKTFFNNIEIREHYKICCKLAWINRNVVDLLDDHEVTILEKLPGSSKIKIHNSFSTLGLSFVSVLVIVAMIKVQQNIEKFSFHSWTHSRRLLRFAWNFAKKKRFWTS